MMRKSGAPTKESGSIGFIVGAIGIAAGLAGNLTTIGSFCSGLINTLLAKPSISIRDVIQSSHLTETFDVSIPATIGDVHDDSRQSQVEKHFSYKIKYKAVLEKRSLPPIKHCQAQLDGLANNTLVSTAKSDLRFGLFDEEFYFEFNANRDSEANKVYFSVVCDGVVSNVMDFSLK